MTVILIIRLYSHRGQIVSPSSYSAIRYTFPRLNLFLRVDILIMLCLICYQSKIGKAIQIKVKLEMRNLEKGSMQW